MRINLQILFLIVWSIILIYSVWFISQEYFPRTIIDVKSEQIDSTKWVSVAKYESIRRINNKLNNNIKEIIEEYDGKITSLINISGTLKLERDIYKNKYDSLLKKYTNVSNEENEIYKLKVIDNKIQDTTIINFDTFNNKLFGVTSKISIKNNSLKNEIKLEQLRPIKISVINTLNSDESKVVTVVESKDFKELNIQVSSPIKHKKEYPWFWIGVSSALGTLLILSNF